MLSLDYNINMKQILVYKTESGKCPYEDWFYTLDKTVQVRVEKRLERVKNGNYGDYKRLDNDLFELRFTYGSGYRIYFTETNSILVILLSAGDKKSQSDDIKKAKIYLTDLIERNK